MVTLTKKVWLIPDTVWYVEEAIDRSNSDAYFDRLRRSVQWSQHTISIFGKKVLCPRLSAWYGEPDARYAYSGLALSPLAWTADLLALKGSVESLAGSEFNSVLLNLYRSGSDSMGWHADDEAELGEEPVIASVSLGAARRFRLKRRSGVATDGPDSVAIDLAHGSLLVMQGRCQVEWKHALPKTTRIVGERINLTFRQIR